MTIRDGIWLAVHAIARRRRPITFGDLSRLEPVSRQFGKDRGTPIDRYLIHRYLSKHRTVIAGDGIEIAEPQYLDRFPDLVTSRTILVPQRDAANPSEATQEILVGDLTDWRSLPEARFDCFVCTQTLQCIYETRDAIRGAHRLLRPGGTLIGTVGGMSQISRYDMDRWGDYWRFTTLSMKKMLGEVFGGDVSTESYGNALVAQMFLQGVAVEDLPDRSVLDKQDDDYQVIIGFCAKKG